MKIINLEYNDINDFLEGFYETEDFLDLKEYEIIDEEKFGLDKILAYDPVCRVTDLGLIFAEGTYLRYDPDTDSLEPDWSLTVIYDDTPDEKFDPTDYVYFEQDSPMVSIHNFLTATDHKVKEKSYDSP